MKILVTGASGLLGSKIVRLATKKDHEIFSGYFNNIPDHGQPIKFDLQDKETIYHAITKIKPNVVIHCAALTDVDTCETNKTLTKKINIDGVKTIAEITSKLNSFLVFISTDYVFDGKQGNYRELDKTNPINYYGYSKLLGERIIAETNTDYLISRVSVIYGNKPASGKINFALWLINNLKNNRDVKILTDQFISPTFNTNLAEMLLEASEKRLKGIYHMAGASKVSRYEFAEKLADTFNLNKTLIKKVKLDDMNWKARRPKDTSLDISKAQKDLKMKPIKLDDALESLKEEIDIAQRNFD
ncbi:dTDP-4-dehydrorhamnose reductase [Candidatus Bathyarchaeota archaeon RBG_13_38_9]|nr:MAG: dTDP-4-dehydrorhamnose reductase [Candidatus Bathyarchaeota archaeon RBG_13_38_9]